MGRARGVHAEHGGLPHKAEQAGENEGGDDERHEGGESRQVALRLGSVGREENDGWLLSVRQRFRQRTEAIGRGAMSARGGKGVRATRESTARKMMVVSKNDAGAYRAVREGCTRPSTSAQLPHR